MRLSHFLSSLLFCMLFMQLVYPRLALGVSVMSLLPNRLYLLALAVPLHQHLLHPSHAGGGLLVDVLHPVAHGRNGDVVVGVD